MKYPQKLKVSTKSLLFIASGVWFFAGGMLFFRGLSAFSIQSNNFLIKIIIALTLGLLFFGVMFSKISTKHILRIKNMEEDLHPVYAFFNKKSYIMMFSMITGGITIRSLNIIPFEYLSVFYVIMGTPLILSAVRFAYNAAVFKA